MAAEYGIITYSTGKVDDVNEGDKLRIIRNGSLTAYKKYVANGYINSDSDYWSYDVYAKVNATEFKLLLPKLDVYERAFIVSIMAYVSFESCEIAYTNHVQIGNDALIEITGLSKPTLFRTIKKLSEKDIIYRGRNSRGIQYFINPWLIMKGVAANKTLKAMFRNYHIQSMGGMKWGSLKEFQK